MNNRQALSRTQLPSTEAVSAFRAPTVVTHFYWFALTLIILSLLTASRASAQTTTGNVALDATLYNANCDPCQGATVGSIKSAIKNATNAMEYLIVNRRGESSDD